MEFVNDVKYSRRLPNGQISVSQNLRAPDIYMY
jgi:hypothetical protein